MTPEEFKAIALPKLITKVVKEITFPEFTTAISLLSNSEKLSLRDALADENPVRVGSIVLNAVKSAAKVKAAAELDSLISDNTLSLDDYARIFN